MLIRHPVLSIKQGLLKVTLATTYRCQCSCVYCCAGQYPKIANRELTVEEIESIILEISRLASVSTLISFFGGEALLRGDIFRSISYANKKGLFTELESNGILLTKETARNLKKSGLHHVFIRLEGSKPDMHDLLSNYKGCFDRALEAIENCRKNRLSCSISTVAIRNKIYNNELKEVIKIGKSLGVASVRIVFPTRAGNWLEEASQVLNKEEEEMVKKLLVPGFVYLESTYVSTNASGRICPSAEKKFFYISPYGQIQPCPFVQFDFGDIRSGGLAGIVKTMWQHRIFSLHRHNACLMENPEVRKYINKE